MVTKVICPEEGCEVQTKMYNLKMHLTSCHRYSEEQIEKFTRELKQEKGEQMGRDSLECVDCGTLFLSRSGLNKHRRLKHPAVVVPEEVVAPEDISLFDTVSSNSAKRNERSSQGTSENRVRTTLACPECIAPLTSQTALCFHYAEEHAKEEDKQLYIIEHMKFPDMINYQIWIERRCKETCTAFCTESSKDNGGVKTCYKKCRHVGTHTATSKMRLGHNSIKEVSACTAFMKMTVVGGEVLVEACFGHVLGHTRHAAALPLSILETDRISSLIESGVPDARIIDQIRKTTDEDDRLYYTTPNDLRNIRERRCLHPGRKDKDDIESVRIRFNEKAHDDGIRVFEPPTDSSGIGFKLVVITPTQLGWLKSYGQRGIIMDDTHNTTRYGLHLTTLMVVDHLDRGLPSGFLLTSGASAKDVEVLLGEIKRLVPEFDTAFVMTDEANCFWNAYVRVFPHTGAQKIICRYHVFMAWKKNGREKLKIDEWATFSRKGTIAQTSMFSEAWHSRLKGAMGKQKGSMRIDRLLQLLINSVEFIRSTNLVNERRGLRNASSRAQQTLAEHRKAVKKYGEKSYLITGGESIFEVGSTTSNTEYKIEKLNACHCSESNTHCAICNACAFDWQCSCLQQMAGVVCSHIHAVVMLQMDNIDEDDDIDVPLRSHTILAPARVVSRSETIDDNRKEQWIENRAVYNRADELMKTLVNSQSNQKVAANTIKTFTDDLKEAVRKMEQSLKEQGMRETHSIAVRTEKRRTGQGGSTEQDLPISLVKRSEVLSRRREQKKKQEFMSNVEEISFLDNEIEVCSICFQTDVDLPSDCDAAEDAMLTTRWQRCTKCRMWAHYECGAARPERNCVACGEGSYENDIGNDSDDSENSLAD